MSVQNKKELTKSIFNSAKQFFQYISILKSRKKLLLLFIFGNENIYMYYNQWHITKESLYLDKSEKIYLRNLSIHIYLFADKSSGNIILFFITLFFIIYFSLYSLHLIKISNFIDSFIIKIQTFHYSCVNCFHCIFFL